ncbi:antibiotic biosynthesis monooxygenase family protein [Pontibaca salina]|uniref:Antibiotic biosynthesis monooxygenase n=1 Tax=Pontibaca salina TaxID=2795731 RepID=A0A934HVX6_9RHOB|nr:antibiotic biosynthesis monooxygenase [Pontibaca salina]MBI6630504.1 antibiotic biosynthesis monooxygenase [Pontibaca salina]
MYLTMNRFKVKADKVEAFEELWMKRDSHLDTVPGFTSFRLMRGSEGVDHVLYVSHTTWESRAAFEGWSRSEAFREAHKNVGESRDLYLEPPHLEVFETVQEAK